MKMPNILFVFADQMRSGAIGCIGEENVKTPNLDAFAAEGTLFTNAVSNHPVCCPARATLITGLHSINHGLVINDQQIRNDHKSIAHYLNSEGYKCGYIGKWHMDCFDRGIFIPPGPRRMGFDDFWAVNECNHNYLNAYYYLNENPEPVWIEGYEPVAQTDLAIEYIQEKSNKGENFCLFLSWGTPHDPYRAVPKKYLDLYPEESIELRPNCSTKVDKGSIAGYYAHVTALDEQFGRLMSALKECNLQEDTIVVFSADHGDMLYSHNWLGKGVPWKESVNIPLIARWPGKIQAGRKSSALVGMVDLMPTLLGLVGIKTDRRVDGEDLSDVFLGDDSRAPKSQLICMVMAYGLGIRAWRGIVTSEYTYARFLDKEWVLYNDKKDPYQLNNLISDPEYDSIRRLLKKELQEQLDKVGDPFYSDLEAYENYVADKVVVSDDKNELAVYLLNEFAKYDKTFDLDANRELTPNVVSRMSHFIWSMSVESMRHGEIFKKTYDGFVAYDDLIENARYLAPMLLNEKIRSGKK
jgi:arylsulfatase A-like enzyme